MKKRILLLLNVLFICSVGHAQEQLVKPSYLNYEITNIVKERILISLDLLINQISKGELNSDLITDENSGLTMSTLENFQEYELRKDSVRLKVKDKQVINLYPVSDNRYSLTIAYASSRTDETPVILYILNLIAADSNGKITFSTPINYLTRYWKTTTIGKITYHYRGEINKDRAELFAKKNILIANKLGVNPEKLHFYMCDNRQEILKLQGIEYSIRYNGKTRDGYGVDSGTIFSVMNNEDFSHDMFHYYSGKINERKNRNWITEEGIAYSWGNAYYTDEDREMITHKRLVNELNKYLTNNPKETILELFKENTKIFNHIAPEISVRSTISGLIANEIEKVKGMEGVQELINCGRKDKLKNYMDVIKDLVGITESNFNRKVLKLINTNSNIK
ncbi:MAG: hypothetical protein COA88_07130 [Kordia sp.]|nr:MAG: hypothetical protein COA88_07130 [Kordia sp.]